MSSRERPIRPGFVVLFGSGEMSPTGRKIHEDIFKKARFQPPVKIGILETPTGYEVNAIHGWPQRMEEFFVKGLKNFKPQVTRIRAWRKDGDFSTNNPAIVDPILSQDYIYCGAGSPGYTLKHLKNSLAYKRLVEAHKNGTTLSLGSATAVAMGKFALPVYEIFKAGEDLHWLAGLNFFRKYGLGFIIVPHWNNQEGEDFDTTRCWMGSDRFAKLLSMLPIGTVTLGIDEVTACTLDFARKLVRVSGKGSAYIFRGGKQEAFQYGQTFPFAKLA